MLSMIPYLYARQHDYFDWHSYKNRSTCGYTIFSCYNLTWIYKEIFSVYMTKKQSLENELSISCLNNDVSRGDSVQVEKLTNSRMVERGRLTKNG